MIRVQNTLAESKRRQAEEIAQVYARAKEREAKLHEEVGASACDWCCSVQNWVCLLMGWLHFYAPLDCPIYVIL